MGSCSSVEKAHFPSLLPIPSLSSYTSSPFQRPPSPLAKILPPIRVKIMSYVWLLSAIQDELQVTRYMQVAEHLFIKPCVVVLQAQQF